MKELEKEFIGRGEVKGFKFKQLEATPYGYIYEVSSDGENPYYEVFKRKENTQFDCISYPRSSSFGKWAWSVATIEKAKNYLTIFEENANKKEKTTTDA